MGTETWFVVVKVAGILFAGVFGLLGTIHDYRDDQNKLTKWGKFSISGIGISITLAVGAEILQGHINEAPSKQATHEALAETRKLDKIIDELGRILQPIESVSLYVGSIKLPMAHKALAKYKNRLDRGITKYVSKPSDEQIAEPGIMPVGTKEKGESRVTNAVQVLSSHELYPDPVDERFALAVLNVSRIQLFFFAHPIDPQIRSNFVEHGDLKIDLHSEDSPSIYIDLETNSYFVFGKFISDNKEWKNRTESIISVPDLVGAQVFIDLMPGGPLPTDMYSEFLMVRKEFGTRSMDIIVNDRPVEIGTEQLHKHVSPYRLFWEYKFPEDPSQLFYVEGFEVNQ